jgi:hypothetical protein
MPHIEIIADPDPAPVFVDATGRRGRRLRAVGYLTAGTASAYLAAIGISLAGGPVTPRMLLPVPGVPDSAVLHAAPQKAETLSPVADGSLERGSSRKTDLGEAARRAADRGGYSGSTAESGGQAASAGKPSAVKAVKPAVKPAAKPAVKPKPGAVAPVAPVVPVVPVKPPAGGTTTPPASGGTTTPPASGGTTTPPASGGTTTPPATGGGTTTPPTTGDNGGNGNGGTGNGNTGGGTGGGPTESVPDPVETPPERAPETTTPAPLPSLLVTPTTFTLAVGDAGIILKATTVEF